ncbi:colanic acid biosynthesis acetyltransferase WcaF [Caulobacter segnis]|uniref:colanic acid biosynthesis acetyltransferase WcaF n=1 Tax=Caulobacter segnis TaxID=88688 RepID=UPI0028561E2B|nr:colanic acid biosynthesis acetyltransferase WcaF [Caulobacter segnis]MDR6624954.1 putative colanic acid biosynthesis acetyltransferase WcaF [Caulobacter segnis]
MTTILDAARSRPMEGGASFPLSHRLLRAAWGVVWGGLGAWTPTPLHGWRRMLLRLFGAKIDKTAKVYPGVRVWYPPNLTMGPYACLGPRSDCYCMAPVLLKDYALVSQGAYICAGTHDIDDPNFQLQAFPITLEARAWVAADAFVGPGVTVGEGAVLGARAVTVKPLAPWSVYAGNPARLIRARTSPFASDTDRP